ncbi:ribonuclease H1 domain-containing protein [Enterococcus sp. DIV1059_1]|uniref:ribonuclease H1 domain-containing protein n=1 Tax=Enterococcus sp. DIV1059_1 TaxID=2774902 RepID=UPI003F23F5C7
MIKYYAVKTGKKPGIYNTWAEAEAQVKGVSNAKYKSFKSEQEALEYIGLNRNDNQVFDDTEIISAYVDGSYNNRKRQYGSGVVLLNKNKVIDELIIAGNKIEYLDSHQIAGEVIGCIEAMKWAVENNKKKLIIYYDYQGIESWAVKEWRAKKPISIDYVTEFDKLKQSIDVEFRKVKGHSGDVLNDLADELAREAANQKIIESAHELENIVDEKDFILANIKSVKNKVDINIWHNNKLYSSSVLYSFIKSKWKKEGNLIKDINSIKTCFVYENEMFLFQIIDKNGNKYFFEVGVGELDGWE